MKERLFRYTNILLGKFSDLRVVPKVHGVSARKQVDIRDNSKFKLLADRIMSEKRSMLYYDRLFHIYQTLLQSIKTANSKGASFAVAEIGVFRGGTSKFICEMLNDRAELRPTFFAIDTFSGHNAGDISPNDLHRPGTFLATGFDSVSNYLSPYGFAKVIEARVQDCLETVIEEVGQFSFVHLDVDIEYPARYVLDTLRDKSALVVGGAVLIDDFGFISCLGLRKTVSEFLDQNDNYFGIELASGQALVVRTK